jgi:hypothetical protein
MTQDSLIRVIRSSLPGFKGPIVVLRGFFDETHTPNHPKLTGVAGALFDDGGLANFSSGWNLITSGRSEIFHATDCCGANGYGAFRNWPQWQRHQWCDQLAKLISETRIACFASSGQQADYESFSIKQPNFSRRAGSLYSICLMRLLERVGYFARIRNEKVFYWFERGDQHLQRVQKDSYLCERYAYFAHSFVPKGDPQAPALIAADLLAWEWQRTISEFIRTQENGSDPNEWSDNLKTTVGPDASAWFPDHFNLTDMYIRGLVNVFHQMN